MEIVKTCKKHGPLTEEDVWREKNIQMKCGFQYRCKKCKQEKDYRYRVPRLKEISKRTSDYKKNNREKVNAWAKQDRQKNPEKYKKWSKISRERIGLKGSLRESLRKLGFSAESYEAMHNEQQGVCRICGNPETRMARDGEHVSRLCIDHDHVSGKVRGLLCHSCNTGLGKFMDDKDLLGLAIMYLEEHEAKG